MADVQKERNIISKLFLPLRCRFIDLPAYTKRDAMPRKLTNNQLNTLKRRLDRMADNARDKLSHTYTSTSAIPSQSDMEVPLHRMPPAEAIGEEYEDIYDNYGYPMEYNAWGQPLEEYGYDWYGMPLVWNDIRSYWTFDQETEGLDEYDIPVRDSPNTPTDPWWDWQSEAWPQDNARLDAATTRLQEYEQLQEALFGKNWCDTLQPEPCKEYEPYGEDWYLTLTEDPCADVREEYERHTEAALSQEEDTGRNEPTPEPREIYEPYREDWYLVLVSEYEGAPAEAEEEYDNVDEYYATSEHADGTDDEDTPEEALV
ncbi:hypothetical protein EDB89DRAFT_1904027 [Lactarius sanguifluus]|nr:hypothetical protein EDB89DRAFT_1904027 [Lactarius sanguifluus]